MINMLFNIIGFNISWFGLVLLGNSFIPLALLFIGLQLYYANHTLVELKLVVSIIIIGSLIDSILMLLGVYIFNEQLIIPFWLITLWGCFASTISHSLQFLSHSKLLQFIVGCIFPPLSYIAGFSLSAVKFGYNVMTTYLVLAILWGGLMLLFFFLKEMYYFQVIKDD